MAYNTTIVDAFMRLFHFVPLRLVQSTVCIIFVVFAVIYVGYSDNLIANKENFCCETTMSTSDSCCIYNYEVKISIIG